VVSSGRVAVTDPVGVRTSVVSAVTTRLSGAVDRRSRAIHGRRFRLLRPLDRHRQRHRGIKLAPQTLDSFLSVANRDALRKNGSAAPALR
jgi:hypothetical protein